MGWLVASNPMPDDQEEVFTLFAFDKINGGKKEKKGTWGNADTAVLIAQNGAAFPTLLPPPSLPILGFCVSTPARGPVRGRLRPFQFQDPLVHHDQPPLDLHNTTGYTKQPS